MVTTKSAAHEVRLNFEWQTKYCQHAQELLPAFGSACHSSKPFCVCIVGRTGVGKGSLVNHLLQQRRSKVSHNFTPELDDEIVFDIHGFRIREIPGYDGLHSIAQSAKRRFHRHHHRGSGSSSSGSDRGSSHGRFELEDFVKAYRIFEEETNAIIFVVSNRITADDQKLLALAAESRKFFCVVRTHGDGLVQIADPTFQKERLEEIEEELRRDLCLGGSLDVRVFILSIPWPESKETDSELDGSDMKAVVRNTQRLNFPLLQAYLSEPKGLRDELQIHAYVKEEISKTLDRFYNVKKRSQLLEFTEQAVAGVVIPIAGPVVVSFSNMLYVTLKACSEIGIIEDADDAMQKVKAETKKSTLISKVATKEGLLTAVHDSLIHIFGKIVFEIAIADVVSTAAEVAFAGLGLPVVGAAVSAAHMPRRMEKIADKLSLRACMLHELWIMQNVTGLLSTVSDQYLERRFLETCKVSDGL